MRLGHLADLHQGFRFLYERERGINVFELDVARALTHAVTGLIAAKVDLVLIAGDVFHSAHPCNRAVEHVFKQLQRLRQALPNVRVVIVGGNHDTPRTEETGSPLSLYTALDGVSVVDVSRQRLVFPELDCAVLAVPHADVIRNREPMAPEGAERFQVLLLHAGLKGMVPGKPNDDGLPASAIHPGFHYGAVGDFHTMRQVAPNAWYSGSIGYSSSDIWLDARNRDELDRPGKCWLLADLATGTVEPQWLPEPRLILDLPTIDAAGLTAEDVLDAMQENLAGLTSTKGAVIRQPIDNLDRVTEKLMDPEVLRRLRKDLLHFQLHIDRPEARAREALGEGAPEDHTARYWNGASRKDMPPGREDRTYEGADLSASDRQIIAMGTEILGRKERAA